MTVAPAHLDPPSLRDRLLERAGRHTGRIPEALLVDHVLAVAGQAGDAVALAAMDAVLRRISAVARDGLRIAARPAGAILGLYRTRQGREARPYETLLASVSPLSGSCSCRDFARSSLGLCKHLLAVLADVGRRPRSLAAAGAWQPGRTRLTWDTVRPLHGDGDPLARIGWSGGLPRTAAARAARRWFGPGDPAPLLHAHAGDPARRLELVRDLRALLRAERTPVSDRALAPLLAAEEARLLRRSGTPGPREIARALKSLGRKLHGYQVQGVKRFLASGRLLLADDMGLGKTAQAIAACHVLHRAGHVRRGLVVVPASLKAQWMREWRSFSDVPVTAVEGGTARRAATYRSAQGFLVAGYEQVLRDLRRIQAFAPEVVVLDEAQRIKNWATKTAACVKQIDAPFRLVLTGTPLENRLDELVSILEWVDDMALEPKWRLSPVHADGDGLREVNLLRERIEPHLLRRLRRDVIGELPARTDTRVPVELTPEQFEEHEALSAPIARLVRTSRTRPLTPPEFLRLMTLLNEQRIVCNGLAQARFAETWPALAGRRPTEALIRTLGAPKLLELRALLANLSVAQERKVVVFSQWTRMLRLCDWAVSDLLAGAGLSAAFFTGDESQGERARSVERLHDDPRTRVLFASDAGGVGLNLQRAASAAILMELPWNPAVLEQRVGRIHRMGQTQPIDVYHLVCEAGIEGRISAIVGDKKALFTGLFDGDGDEIRLDRSGSFLSRMQQLVPESDPAAPEEEDPPLEPAPVPLAAEPQPAWNAGTVPQLLERITVRPRADGGLSIEAPPEAAAALAGMFSAMARMLSAAG